MSGRPPGATLDDVFDARMLAIDVKLGALENRVLLLEQLLARWAPGPRDSADAALIARIAAVSQGRPSEPQP